MNKQTVFIATTALLDEKTFSPGLGGLQRWCRDVAGLISDKGYPVTILQKSSTAFEIIINDNIKVVGVASPMSFWGNMVFSRLIRKLVPMGSPIIFVSQELMFGGGWKNCIAVNHGIWWDSDFASWKLWINKVIQRTTLLRARAVICVDTNYINWCHAEIAKRVAWRQRMIFVPNYADEKLFNIDLAEYSNCSLGSTDYEIRILCPRRMPDVLGTIWDGRGALLLLESLVLLNATGAKFVVEFAGTGLARNEVLDFADRNGLRGKIVCKQYELDEMPIAYANADVVVIPTASHEGTSLAAVEAMCCGKATVVTHVGGLPNLVIDGINGYISNLSPQALCDSILRATKNARNLAWLKNSAEISIAAFGKSRWQASIWEILRRNLILD